MQEGNGCRALWAISGRLITLLTFIPPAPGGSVLWGRVSDT